MKQDVEMLTQGLNTYVAYSEEELSKKNRINDAIRTEGGAAATGTAAQGEPKSTLTFKLFKKVQRTHTVKDIYTPLERMLDSSSCYDAIHVNDNLCFAARCFVIVTMFYSVAGQCPKDIADAGVGIGMPGWT